MSNEKLAEALRQILDATGGYVPNTSKVIWRNAQEALQAHAAEAAHCAFTPAWVTDTVHGIRDCLENGDDAYAYLQSRVLAAAPQPQPAQDAKDGAREEWHAFAENYEVSSNGRIRSHGRLLQPYIKGKGYLAVSVWQGGKNKEMYVHRVVASAFCRRDDSSQDQVNHRDGDKLNNYASNLEWCTAKENRMHAARVLFSATRPVVGTNLKTGETITFMSLAEAEEHGFIRANIQKCIAGIRKKHGGFAWRDADDSISAMAKESGR